MENAFGFILTAMSAMLGFFLVRFIGKHDDFQDETKREFKKINYSIEENHKEIKGELSKITVNTGIDAKTESRLGALEKSLKDSPIFVQEVKTQVKENYGKVLWLEDNQKEQDKKILTLYKAVKKIVKE